MIKRKGSRKRLILCMILILSQIMWGCASPTDELGESQALSENQYYVYYRDGDSNSLKAEVYTVTSDSQQDIIKELFEQLRTPPNKSVVSTVPKDLVISSSYREGESLTLNFCSSYTNMSFTDEILCRTAVVKTMLQLDGVNGITFNVADQPLVSSTGRTVGVMTQDSFEDSINQSLKKTNLVLYFADESGTSLVKEERSVMYRSGESLERLVVENLIEGPQTMNRYPVLDSSLSLTGISVTDGVCYVYFNTDFLQNSLDVADYIPIYAIVNSLSELSNVSRVQFVIGGSQDVTFREAVSLSGTLSRNQDYISKE